MKEPRENQRLPRRRAAFTLIEMAVATSIAGILVIGIASAISIAAKAIPGKGDAAEVILDSARTLQSVGAELECATEIDASSATGITFRLPDRNNDSAAEVVQYAWSGVPGAPLTRSYNGGPASAIADSVLSFALAYTTTTVSESSTTTEPTTTDEVEFASFSGWAGIATPTIQSYTVSASSYLCQSFRVTVPADTTAIIFTRIKAHIRSFDTTGGRYSFAIHLAAGGASSTPQSIVGSALSLATNTLTTTFANPDLWLTGARTTNLGPDFSIVVGGNVANAVQVRNYYSLAATDNATMMGTSTNAGGSWTMSGNSRDALFNVFGKFEKLTEKTVTTSRTLLTSARLTMETSAGEASTSALALNRPEMH